MEKGLATRNTKRHEKKADGKGGPVKNAQAISFVSFVLFVVKKKINHEGHEGHEDTGEGVKG